MSTNPANRERRWQQVAYSAFGLLPLTLGCAMTLYIYAWASIVNPRLPMEERRALILEGMFHGPQAIVTIGGLLLMAAGLCILLYGVVSFFRRVRPSRFAMGGAIVAGAAAVLLCGLLFMFG